MKSYKNLAWPFYLTGLVIIIFPAVEYVLTIWPLSFGVISWRFGAVGLLTRAIMTPMVGLALVFGTAVLLEHTWVQRGVAVLGIAGTAVLILAVVMFTLDLFQFRNQVRPEASLAYDVSSGMALTKLFAGTIVLLSFGLSALRMVRRAGGKKSRRSAPATLVARPSKSETDSAEEKEESAEIAD